MTTFSDLQNEVEGTIGLFITRPKINELAEKYHVGYATVVAALAKAHRSFAVINHEERFYSIELMDKQLIEEHARAEYYKEQLEEFDDYDGDMEYWPEDKGGYHKHAPSLVQYAPEDRVNRYRKNARLDLEGE